MYYANELPGRKVLIFFAIEFPTINCFTSLIHNLAEDGYPSFRYDAVSRFLAVRCQTAAVMKDVMRYAENNSYKHNRELETQYPI